MTTLAETLWKIAECYREGKFIDVNQWAALRDAELEYLRVGDIAPAKRATVDRVHEEKVLR